MHHLVLISTELERNCIVLILIFIRISTHIQNGDKMTSSTQLEQSTCFIINLTNKE